MLPVSRRRLRRLRIVVPVVVCIILLHYLWNLPPSQSDPSARSARTTTSSTDQSTSATTLPCNQLAGSEDIVIVLKTGATEALDRVPVHFQTTFRCSPDYLIFSDYAEEIEGHPVYDCLRNVDDDVKKNHPDFALYNRLLEHGRQSLEPDELSGTDTSTDSNIGNLGNEGWRLDKWKFLPLVDEVLQKRPDAKWFFFMEADTFLMWSNLLQWVKQLDPKRPYYIGGQMQIGPVIFAHGGAGFLVSNPALRILSDYRATRVRELDRFTSDHWAGDCVLGKTMQDAGVPLIWSWPSIQNERLSVLDHNAEVYNKRVWCHPAVTYHHMTAEAVESIWEFEQNWIRDVSLNFRSIYPLTNQLPFRPPLWSATVTSLKTTFYRCSPTNAICGIICPTAKNREAMPANHSRTAALHVWRTPTACSSPILTTSAGCLV